MVDRASRELGFSMFNYDDNDVDQSTDQHPQQDAIGYGTHYVCNHDGIYDMSSMTQNKTRKEVKWIHPYMRQHLHSFLKKEVLYFFTQQHEHAIALTTSAKINGIIYRADPGGARSNSYKRGRHDWVSILWSTDKDQRGIPARIITFFRLPTLFADSDDDLPTYYDGYGLYAVVASVPDSLYTTSKSADDGMEINQRCHQATQLVYRSQLEVDPTFSCPSSSPVMMPKLYVVKVDSDKFLDPIIAIPYFWKDKLNEIDWMFVEPRCNWDFLFDQCAKELLP